MLVGEVPQVHVGLDGSQTMELEGEEEGAGAWANQGKALNVGGGNVGNRDIGVGEGSSKKPRLNDDVIGKGSNVLPWSRVLCGSFMGEKQEPELSLIDFRIRREWKAHGIEVENIMKNRKKGLYIFIFETNEGMLNALEKGTWTIGDVKIVLKEWGPAHMVKIPCADYCRVCIQIYGMPLELWKVDVVRVMSSIVGYPGGVDRTTKRVCEIGRRGPYARVMVDLGKTRDVVDEISVSYPNPDGDGFLLCDLRIEYEYMCSFCKVNDHSNSCCGALIAKEKEREEARKLQEMMFKDRRKEMMEYPKERGYEAPDTSIKVSVARDKDLIEQIGKDIYFDLVGHDKVWSFRVERRKSFNSVKEEVARVVGVPVECQRFWTWAKRQNQTYRPYRPLTRMEEAQSVGQLKVAYNNNQLNLFLETVIGPDSCPRPLPHISEEDILVFFKLYDPDKLQLRYVCRLFVRSSGNPTEIMSELKANVGFSPDEEIELYEEVKFERYHEQEFDSCVMCERLDKTISFGSSQIRNGDIICFQKLSQDWDKYEYPDVPSFLEYVKNRQVVHFRSKDKPKEEAFSLELSKLHTYDDVASKVANKLGLDDPSKIMFTAHNSNLNPPDSNYQVEGHLLDMLGDCNKGYDILYYQIFEIPLPDLQGLTNLKVAFYQPTNKEEPVIHSIWLPNQSTVGDVLTEINRKVNVDAQLRLLQLDRHKILEVFSPTLKIEYIDYEVGPLRAEKIPEEEKVLGPGDRRIDVCHFTKEQEVKNFGESFFLVIREHETLADVKLRIRLMLEVPHDEFSKWKFAVVYRTSPEYLQDSDIVSSAFQRTLYPDSDPPYLGLEHLEQPLCLE